MDGCALFGCFNCIAALLYWNAMVFLILDIVVVDAGEALAKLNM